MTIHEYAEEVEKRRNRTLLFNERDSFILGAFAAINAIGSGPKGERVADAMKRVKDELMQYITHHEEHAE